MAVLLLRVADPAFRGRVMGVRMLVVYGMGVGLLLAGPLVEHTGFSVTGSIFSVVGIVCTVLIGVHWRRHLWNIHADANAR
jgi:multidrug transporter EmrE-like cation transporter